MTTCIRRPYSVWTACKCDKCRATTLKMAKLARNGGYRRITSDQAWATIEPLIKGGWSSNAIASAANLSPKAMSNVLTLYRQGTRVKFGHHHAAALVNIGTPTKGSVGVIPIRRRLQALAVMGWTLDTISEATGIGQSTLAAIRNGQTTKHIRVALAASIVGTYDRLHMTPGTSSRATIYAQKAGWAAPLAWDNIDDQAEQPKTGKINHYLPSHSLDPVKVDRILNGERLPASRAERREVIRRWETTGGSYKELSRITGWHVQREQRNAGIEPHIQEPAINPRRRRRKAAA